MKGADINVVTDFPVHFALLMWVKVSRARTYSILGMLHMVFEDKYTMSCKEIPVAILLLSVFTNGLEYLSLKSISVYFEPKTSFFVARCWYVSRIPHTSWIHSPSLSLVLCGHILHVIIVLIGRSLR